MPKPPLRYGFGTGDGGVMQGDIVKEDRELYLQEIDELTDLMRTDPDWDDLKTCFVSRGFDPNKVFLAAFIETEDEQEFGVFVTDESKVFEYQRSTQNGREHQFTVCVELPKNDETFSRSPAIELALELVRNA